MNVINLPRRLDRYNSFVEQANEQNITYKIWEGIEIQKSRKKGITLSHKQIIKWAKDTGQEMVCVAEDDIRFFGQGAWDYFLQEIPSSFDIFFSMIYVGRIDDNNRIITACSGMTMYIVHKRFYDVFLSIPDDCHVDRTITGMFDKYEFIVCNPMVCEQNGSFSDNSMTTKDYKGFLIGRNIYKG